MTQHDQLYRLVYVSQNVVPAAQAETEIISILAVSRRNNVSAGVTGALLFSATCFAQTLEGPVDEVEATFERIQCDPRHRETVILQAGPVPRRDFGDWSMAYAGRVDDAKLQFKQIVERQAAPDRSHAAQDILGLMRGVVQRSELV